MEVRVYVVGRGSMHEASKTQFYTWQNQMKDLRRLRGRPSENEPSVAIGG